MEAWRGIYLFNFSVMNVPTDGLTPLGARTSAGTVMNQFK